MDCPRCGEPDVSGPECSRCGVILAKARQRREGSPLETPAAHEVPRGRTSNAILLIIGVAAAVWALWQAFAPGPAPAGVPSAQAPSAEAAPSGPLSSPGRDPIPPLLAPSVPSPHPIPKEVALEPSARQTETGAADQLTVNRLAILLRTGRPIEAPHLQQAEELYERYGAPITNLLEALLLNAAAQERKARRYDETIALLRRAADVAPGSIQPLKAHAAVLLETGDWRQAEVSARAAMTMAPADPEPVQGLAYALVRQNRSPEAIEVLESFLDDYDNSPTRALLQRIQGDLAPEAGLREQRIAHFHVRYDGDTHEAVGREVLRVLDRHYAILVRRFGHQPGSPIPVILLSRESYYGETGAPAWSGGRYDSFDGRVRLPIGGLTASLTPEIDDTLLHELTHAFVTDISRGVAPREIQEGLAQLIEGKRVEDLLSDAQLTALAEGRIRGAGGFYLASLSFTQHLMAQRGQGGINDLLVAMAETGDANGSFERVYRRDLASLHRDWQTRLRHQYGR